MKLRSSLIVGVMALLMAQLHSCPWFCVAHDSGVLTSQIIC